MTECAAWGITASWPLGIASSTMRSATSADRMSDAAPRTTDAHGPVTSALTEAEAERAAELEAQLVAQEKAAADARAAAVDARVRRGAARGVDPELAGQPLSVRAAREYAYVARDVRRIGLTAGLLLAVLISLAIAINILGIIQI